MIEITGRITRRWTGSQDGVPPINVVVTDDSKVNYKATFWKPNDYEIVRQLKDGDEITFSGYIKDVYPYNHGITLNVLPDRLISYALTERKLVEVKSADKSEQMTAEIKSESKRGVDNE